jgi:hypothetical protein
MRKNRFLTASAALLTIILMGASASAQTDTTRQQPRRTIFGSILDQIIPAIGNGGSTGLTATEIGQGLKEALRVGVDKGAGKASAIDGYFANALIKLSFPPEAQNVANKLRQIGLGRQVDQFELSLNRAAEGAASRAKPIFWSAVTQMSIPDAVGILRGPQDAATQYLRKTSGQQLVAAFTPVIDSTLRSNNVTRYYTDLVTTYNRIPFVKKANPNLTSYATNRAVDGLFVLVAQEEQRIRQDPAARVSDILRRVFGK